MITITDSNIIFSALIKPDGNEGTVLKSKGRIQFLTPDFLLDEIKDHSADIQRFSILNKTALRQEFDFLRKIIKITDRESIPPKKLREAYEIVKDIDEEDTFFAALNFHTGHKIWTGDKILIKGLLDKSFDICITTEELKKMLYKKE